MHAHNARLGIGALELKRAYQPAMLTGLLIAVLLHMCLVGASLIWDASNVILPISTPDIEGHVIEVEIVPPTSIPPPEISHERWAATEPPDIGTPVGVEDDLVIVNPDFPTRLELENMQASTLNLSLLDGHSGSSSLNRGTSLDEYIPGYDEFVAVECLPVPIIRAIPIYPEVAALTGIEGEVWVQALVGHDGTVQKARIAKPSGTNAGLEEAALAAAHEGRFKPALQNNEPVAVWVTYKVTFKLAAGQ